MKSHSTWVAIVLISKVINNWSSFNGVSQTDNFIYGCKTSGSGKQRRLSWAVNWMGQADILQEQAGCIQRIIIECYTPHSSFCLEKWDVYNQTNLIPESWGTEKRVGNISPAWAALWSPSQNQPANRVSASKRHMLCLHKLTLLLILNIPKLQLAWKWLLD